MIGGVVIVNLGGLVMQHFIQNVSRVSHISSWIITSHKQFQIRSLQPELLAFIFSPPPSLFHMVGVLMCHPSNSPSCFILLKSSISWFPPSSSSIPTCLSLGGPTTKARSSLYESFFPMLFKPLPFYFQPFHLFSGVLFFPLLGCPNPQLYPHTTTFPDTDSWVSLPWVMWKSIPHLLSEGVHAEYSLKFHSTNFVW